jgi:putative oxidoreductase
MTPLLRLHDAVFARIESATPWLLPTLARLIFAGLFLIYFWKSAATKFGGLFTPTPGAYAQIFPKAMEAAGYDVSQLSALHTLVVLAGTYAEFLLPALILVGLFTRLAALGMIGFILVQSWVDITGHGLGEKDIGAWFDRDPSALILDQRVLWIFLLILMVVRGAGPISLDRIVYGFRPKSRYS